MNQDKGSNANPSDSKQNRDTPSLNKNVTTSPIYQVEKADREQEISQEGRAIIRLTRWLVFWTFILAICGAASGYVFYQQWQEMRHASDQTDKAIVAANRAADAAAKNTDVLINSERARLFIGSIILKKTNENDPQPRIDYTWINLGRGPAVITDVLVTCAIVGSQIPVSPLDDIQKIKRGQTTLGSGATGGSFGVPIPLPPCVLEQQLTPTDWKELETKNKFILLSGFIRYQDAFHKYKWHFGDVYHGDLNFFSTSPLPPSYNEEIQEDEKK